MWINAPAIAALRGTTRVTEYLHIRDGHYGPAIRHGTHWYAALAAVEQRNGAMFTPAQVAAAVAGRPHRSIQISTEVAA